MATFEQALTEARRARGGDAALPELQRAIAAYGGDFLAGLAAGEWAQSRRDELRRSFESALLASDLKQAGVPYSLEYLYGLRHGFEFHINDQVNLLPQVVTFLNQAFDHEPITTATP